MFKNLLAVVFMLSALPLFAQTEKTKKDETDYKQPGAPMPRLHLIPIDSITETKKERKHRMKQEIAETNPGSGNLFVMIFNPTCGHCEDQTDRFITNSSKFKNSHLYMVANSVMRPYLADFVKNHHIKEHPYIKLGIDSSGFIDKVFMWSSLPQINIYDHDRKLIKLYNGEVHMDSLTKYIE